MPVSENLVRRIRRSPQAPALAVVVAMLASVELFPKAMPGGIYLSGVVFGCWTGFITLGLVLVFRSSRLINFTAYQCGGSATLLFIENLHHHWIARLLTGHLHGPAHFPSWATTTEYWAGAVLALAVAVVLSALTYVLVVRRLAGSPPLVGTVATVGVLVLLAIGTGLLQNKAFKDPNLVANTFPPQNLTVHLGGAVFHLPELITLVLALLSVPLLEIYLRRSRLGTGMRAAAENTERAATLGVDSVKVTAVAWMIAGALSGLSTLLVVAATGPSQVGGVIAFVPPLAALILAGTVSLRLGMLAAIATGVLQQGLVWSYSKGDVLDAILLGAVVAVLLVRYRRSSERVDLTDSSWRAAREVRRVPPELRGHPDVRRLHVRFGAVAALVAVLYPFVMPTGDVTTGSITLVYAIVGLSLLMLTGWSGLISLGQFAFAAVGAFTTAVLVGKVGVPALPALVLGSVSGGAVALVIGLPALRIRGLYLAVVTLALSVTTATMVVNPAYAGRWLPATLNRPRLFGLSTDDERAFYFLCLVVTVGCLLAVAGLRRSKTARALIASRDNERAAELFGVDLVRARLLAFVASGVLAALAGGLFAFSQKGVDVGNFSADQSLTMFLMVIIGGLGSLAGPVLGAVFLGILTIIGNGPASAGDSWSALALPIAVLTVLMAVPGGLTQAVFAARDARLRQIALRHRIVVPSLVDANHPGWTPDKRVPLAPEAGYVEPRYTLEHRPLKVPKVASTGRGA